MRSYHFLIKVTVKSYTYVKRCSLLRYLNPKLQYQTATTCFKDFYYARQDVLPSVKSFSSWYMRTDIVFDTYRPMSLKAETRSQRKRCQAKGDKNS